MDLISLGLQLVTVLTASALTFALIGPGPYLAIALVIAMLTLCLFVTNGMRDVLTERALAPAWFVGTLFLAMMLGACWPLGPIVVGYYRVKLVIVRGDDEDDADAEAGGGSP